MKNTGKIINGSNMEYRYPIFPNQPAPEIIQGIDGKIYARSLFGLLGFTALILWGLYLFWFGRDRDHPTWLVVTILVVSIFPMAFIIWNGNPLEIERHMAQIGIQLRLAGWLALLLFMDWLGQKYFRNNKKGSPAMKYIC